MTGFIFFIVPERKVLQTKIVVNLSVSQCLSGKKITTETQRTNH